MDYHFAGDYFICVLCGTAASGLSSRYSFTLAPLEGPPYGYGVLMEPLTIITTRATQRRYYFTLQELTRQRNAAAYEWSRLRWWQWRKRRRLWRVLFGIGGWSIEPLPGIPERVVPRRYGLGYRVLNSNRSSFDNPDR